MNTKVKKMPLEKVLAIKKEKKFKPKKPNLFWRTLIRILSSKDLKSTGFKLEKSGMERLGKKEPCLILMNHTSFIDLKIAETAFYPRPLNIVTSLDGFIGLKWLMRQIGCFPTRKFTPERQVITNMKYCLETLKTSVLLFPEAGYSIDGRATTLPESLGKCLKYLGVPVVTLISSGAYSRQPLYNNLRKRKVQVSAKMEYFLSPDEIQNLSVDEINQKLRAVFGFDAYRWQKENGVTIDEPNRAEGLDRILYKCPACLAEGETVGAGDKLVCKACGKEYFMTETGEMQAVNGETEISHIPDWYAWERKSACDELVKGEYCLEDEVQIYALVNAKALYDIGKGRLKHDGDGFTLYGKNGEVIHAQKPLFSYSVNADFYWYEIGDVVYIGNSEITYCCVPQTLRNVVAKMRLATEELYKLKKAEKA
ncbi:MAG: 1-acyl-sn-glycerol-3-phosphate acyltransferase [Clostridia bacterium]|nr:1-acyl-sn-glycerol-3-phosphate acyltransferase [Clostridia bacterium]